MSDELTDPVVRRSEGEAVGGHATSTSGGESGAPAVAPRARRPNTGPGPDFAEKVARAGREVGGRIQGTANGRGHPEGCQCPRCFGFTAGPNGTGVQTVGLKHGARSLVQIQGRASEVAEQLALRLAEEQLWRESFRPAVEACALVLVRLERSHAALDQCEEEHGPLATSELHAKLMQDASRWANSARGYLADLGLTPRALAAIARDTGLARSTRTADALRSLAEHVEREHE